MTAPRPKSSLPWPRHDDDLRRLWATGMSARLIGLEISALFGGEIPITKNSVVGRSHRLGLTGRPSPIVPHKSHCSRAVLRQIAADAKAAQATQRSWVANNEVSAFAPVVSIERTNVDTAPRIANVVSGVGRAYSYLAPVLTETRRCCFPLWGNERPGKEPLFCKAAQQVGKPYCVEHARRCYRNDRDVGLEDAA